MIRDKIIIVEDDPGISKYLQAALRSHEYDTLLAPDGKTALEMIASHCPDLLLLDLGLPDMDGSEIIRSVRAWSRMPIIIISARSAEIDKASALDMGADDYLTKPVDLDELLLHVQALLRRSQAMTSHQLTIGQTHLDYDSLTVQRGDTLLTLPKKEFFLLFKLLSSPMQIFTRRQLMDEIWGMDAQSDERTVDVHIKRLREKCEIFPDFSIVTVRGLGYKAVKNG